MSASGSDLRLDHIGIAVRDLDAACAQYSELLGVEPSGVEHVASESVRVAFFELTNCRVELLAPTDPASAVARFLDRGGSGLHHVAFAGGSSASLAERLAELRESGVRTIGNDLRPGSEGRDIFFVHPSAASGALLEFMTERDLP